MRQHLACHVYIWAPSTLSGAQFLVLPGAAAQVFRPPSRAPGLSARNPRPPIQGPCPHVGSLSRSPSPSHLSISIVMLGHFIVEMKVGDRTMLRLVHSHHGNCQWSQGPGPRWKRRSPRSPKGDSRKCFCLASLLRLYHVLCSPSKSACAGRKHGPGDPGFPGGVSPL